MKIADFGLSVRGENIIMDGQVTARAKVNGGTYEYASPEVSSTTHAIALRAVLG